MYGRISRLVSNKQVPKLQQISIATMCRSILRLGSEVDSPLPRKLRRMDVEMLSSSSSKEFKSLQLKHLSFTTTPGTHFATTTALKSAEKSPLDCQRQEMEENLQVLKVQIASTKEELGKLNSESRHFQPLSDIGAQLCNNCHCGGHTKVNAQNLLARTSVCVK